MTEWATAQGRGRNNKRRNNKSESQAKAADIKGYTKADPAHAEDELTIHDLPPEVHAHLFGFFNARDLLWPVPVVCSYWREESLLQKKGRVHEFKVIEEYNVFKKPSFLTWSQFYSELSSFQLTLKFPAMGASRFTLTALTAPPQQPQQQQRTSKTQQPTPSVQPQQPSQRKSRRRRGKAKDEDHQDEDEDHEDDLLPLSVKQKQQQQNAARDLHLKQQQKRQPQPQLQQLLPQQKIAKNVVDVGLALKSDVLGDFIRCAFDLAFRSKLVQGNMTACFPTSSGRVYFFFDLDSGAAADKESEKDRLYAYHRNLISQSQQIIHKNVNLPPEVKLVPQERFTNRMTVQVLVDAKDAFREGKREDDLKEEQFEDLRAGLREVTVARVSVLCWVIHLCRAFDATFKGKTKESYERHFKHYDFPWHELSLLKAYIPFFDRSKVVWDYPDQDNEDAEGNVPSSKRRSKYEFFDLWHWDYDCFGI